LHAGNFCTQTSAVIFCMQGIFARRPAQWYFACRKFLHADQRRPAQTFCFFLWESVISIRV